MADTKTTGLSAFTPVLTDIMYGVDDPGGTPISGKHTYQVLLDLIEANFAGPASAITSGTFADALVAQSNVTQHEAALTITESQISDLQTYLTDLSGDTTPQLGGSLDVNGQSIVSVSNGNITLTPNGTGNVVLGNYTLNADATVGPSQDNFVLTYDDASGTWGPEVGSGDSWGDAVDADIVPDADGTRDLGTSAARFAELHVDTIDLNGVTLDGTTLADPGADRMLFWDDSASTTAYLTAGTGLDITTTTMTVDVAALSHNVTTDADNYTLVIGDQNGIVLMSGGSANTLTIPTNASVAFPTGTKVEVWSTGAGTTSIAGDTGVTLQGAGGSASAGSCDIQTQYGGATLTKIATDTWIVGGDIDAVA